eukprot:gene17026-23317_t
MTTGTEPSGNAQTTCRRPRRLPDTYKDDRNYVQILQTTDKYTDDCKYWQTTDKTKTTDGHSGDADYGQ